jgi:TolA-binding protein
MRKLLFSVLAAASTLAVAAPASAQWAPPVYHYQPYNYNSGFNFHNYARTMQARVQRVRTDIRNMDARRILSNREARSLDNQARNIERRIYTASRNGIQRYEARNLENRIRNLEMRVSREATDWNNRPGHRRY